MLEKMEGIILKTQDFKETHKIVTIFGKRTGKFTAIARGAKKPRSRMAAVTQPFIYGDFLVYLGSGLGTVQQGEVQYSFRAIREDIFKTAYTAYITELTDKIIDEKKPNDVLFNELYQTMLWISNHEEVDIPIMMYELKLFELGGFGPVLDRCVNCSGNQFPYVFSIQEGGLLCTRCKELDQNAISLSHTITKLLHLFVHIQLERVGNISVKKDTIILLRQILDAYYDTYGGYFLKSKRFLHQMKRLHKGF